MKDAVLLHRCVHALSQLARIISIRFDCLVLNYGGNMLTLHLLCLQAFIQSMGTMGEVSADYRASEEDQWMEQQSSARLFERSRIKVLAGS